MVGWPIDLCRSGWDDATGVDWMCMYEGGGEVSG